MKDIYKSKKQLIKELEDLRWKASQGKTGTLEEYPARAKADPVSEVPDYKRDKESLLLIRKAIDSATDAIGLSDPEGHHVYQNKTFTNLFEYTAEELAAVGIEAAFAVKSTAREVLGSIMSGRSWSGEVEMRAKSGRVFGLSLRADAIKDDAGKIVGLVGFFTDISERKRMEYQLRKKHDELQLILDSIPAYVFYKDKDGKMLNINKAVMAQANTPKEKLLQKTVFDLMPETADKYNRDDMEVIRSGQPKINIEESLDLPSGKRWLKTDKLPIKDDDGSIVGLLGFSVDITDRKKAEDELAQSEVLLRSFFSSPGLICGVVELEGDDIRYITVNAAMAEMYGLKPEDVSNRLAREIGMDRGIVELFIDNYKKSKENDAPAYFEYHRGVGPETRWFFVTVTFLGLETNRYRPRFAFVTSDITERRRAEEALRNSEEKLRVMFETMTDAVVLTDLNGTVLDINASSVKMFGYSKDEVIDRNGLEVLAFEDKERATRNLASSMYETEIIGIQEYKILDKNGRVVSAEINVNRLADVTGKPYGFIVVIRDVTDRKKTEAELRLIRKAVQNSSDAIGMTDAQGHHFYQNESYRGLFGYEVDELNALGGAPAIFKDHKIALDIFDVAISGGEWTGEVEMVSKGGRTFPVFLRANSIKSEAGNVIGVIGVHTDVTGRKIAEQALLESEGRYRLLAENATDLIWTMDMNLKYIYVSPSVLSLRGYTAEEAMRMSLEETLTIDSIKTAMQVLKEELEVDHSDQYTSRTLELELKCKDGSTVWAEVKVAFLYDANRNRIGILGITRDITERRKIDQKIRESEERYRLLAENVSDVIWLTNLHLEYLYVSPSIERLMGFTPEEFMAMTWSQAISKESLEIATKRLVAELELEKAGGADPDRVVTMELEVKKKDGFWIWTEIKITFMRDNDGKAIGLLGVTRDISERKRAEAEIIVLSNAFRAALDPILILDMEGKVRNVNDAARRLFETEELGVSALDYAVPEDREKIIAAMQGLITDSGVNVIEFTIVTKSGRRVPIEATGSLMIDANGKSTGIVVVERDITQRKRAEEDIKRHAKRVEALYGVAQVISQSSKLDTMLKDALGKVCAAMNTESGCIFMLDFDKSALKLRACKDVSENTMQQFSTIVMTEQGMEGLVKLTGPITEIDETQDVIEPEKMKKVTADIGRKGIAAVPFFRGKDLQGLIVIFTTKDRTFSSEDLELLKAISNEISIGINNLMLLEKTREMSVTDELTGLYNRRYFFETLDVEMNRASRTKHPFSLVMLDLDGFKEYNDKYGHINGDSALQTFSQMLKSSIRKSDIAFRYGGDEFALILPSADAERAKKIVQRTRAKWQKAPLAQSRIFGGHVGFSTGIAEYPENAESSDGLIFLADAALYQAKKKGYEDKLVSELRTLSTDIMDVATQDQVYALAATVDARDPYTYGHSQRVAEIAMSIGKRIGMSGEDLAKLQAAALLHDIGKVGVPDSILTKVGKPTPEEWDVIKKHCSEGARIVSYVKELASLVPIILHHHEWYDGSGYPGGLKGIDIPSGARITCVADAYDTMVTKRPYREVISPREACEELKRNTGTQFDPVIVDVWFKLVEKASKKDK